jgi:hypothetical protein
MFAPAKATQRFISRTVKPYRAPREHKRAAVLEIYLQRGGIEFHERDGSSNFGKKDLKATVKGCPPRRGEDCLGEVSSQPDWIEWLKCPHGANGLIDCPLHIGIGHQVKF